MLKNRSTYNPMAKRYISLEHIGSEVGFTIHGVEVLQKKDELDIINTFSIQDISKIKDEIKEKSGVYLVINDDQILSKKVQISGTDEDILNDAFPNVNTEEFYYEILKTATCSFISICRKNYVDNIINQYEQAKINIIGVSLGVLKTASLSSLLKSEQINTHNVSLLFNGLDLNDIVYNEVEAIENYTIDAITLQSTYVNSFGAIWHQLSNQSLITGNTNDKNSLLFKEFKEKEVFRKALQFGLGALLILLLINFLVFNNTYKKWQSLQEEIQVFSTQSGKIEEQLKVVNTKEKIVKSILTTGFSKSSYFIDQIIQILPTTITLTSFSYQPLQKTIRPDKAIQLDNNQIKISGKSIEKESYTNWLNAIEKLSFVNKVTIINYGSSSNTASNFEIIIDLAHDSKK